MTDNLGWHFAILRFIPILILIALAFGLDYLFGLDRLLSAGIALIVATLVRIALMRFWK